MAKVKVFSRFPDPMEFRFTRYVSASSTDGQEVSQYTDEDRIVLNGTTEIVNHTLVTREGAVTIFGFDRHDVARREYTTEDLARLKEHPMFRRMLKNGDLSIGVIDDLSRDFNGVGMLSEKELRQRSNDKSPDSDGLKIGS